MLRVQLGTKQPAQPCTSNSGASYLTLFLVMQASSDRMASFQKVIERSHSQVTSLKASVNNIFQAVSAKRFRDVAPDIRALVIEGIAHWTTSLPADFLQDQYLKYVAWALSDRVIATAVVKCNSHVLFKRQAVCTDVLGLQYVTSPGSCCGALPWYFAATDGMVSCIIWEQGRRCSFCSSSSRCIAIFCIRCQHCRVWQVVMSLLICRLDPQGHG